MNILTKEQYQEFDEFVETHPLGGFTQCSKWAEVKKDWGHEIIVSRDENGKIIGGMLVLIKKVPLFKYSLLYAPRGPIFDLDNKNVLMDLMEGVKSISKKYNAYQFKMDPYVLSDNQDFINMAKSIGFSFTPDKLDYKTIQTRHNYMLIDIKGKTADEVFASFHKKWRYNTRVAIKHNVECKVCGIDALPDFYKIYVTTGMRDNFTPRPISYFENLFASLGDIVRLYICYYEGNAISGAITTQYAGKTCYVYGASDNAHRNVMPNHLMQWTMIQWAVENGDSVYDFQGIPVDISGDSEMHGVYLFKKGFNGETVMFAGEFDYALNSFGTKIVEAGMKANLTAKTLKRKLRGKK